MINSISFLAVVSCICQAALAQTNTVYEIVLVGGRVITAAAKLIQKECRLFHHHYNSF